MKYESLGLTFLLVALAGSALAQTQVFGTLKCGDNKGDIQHTVEVGDHPGHVLVVGKGTCTWTAPLVIVGLKSTTQTGASTTEVNGAKFQDRGYAVIMMENGDKVYIRNQDTGIVMEGGKNATYEGTFSFTGGTGKFKRIKGKGTYKGSGATKGETNLQAEGEYMLPGAGKPQ